jgi:hypothetical protein
MRSRSIPRPGSEATPPDTDETHPHCTAGPFPPAARARWGAAAAPRPGPRRPTASSRAWSAPTAWCARSRASPMPPRRWARCAGCRRSPWRRGRASAGPLTTGAPDAGADIQRHGLPRRGAERGLPVPEPLDAGARAGKAPGHGLDLRRRLRRRFLLGAAAGRGQPLQEGRPGRQLQLPPRRVRVPRASRSFPGNRGATRRATTASWTRSRRSSGSRGT